MAHDRYGKLEKFTIKNRPVFELQNGFFQVTLSCLPVFGRSFPWAGGGYFRLFPYVVFKACVRRILASQEIYTFYIHPWEFDPEQLRVRNIPWQFRFRHYNNLRKTKSRFRNLVHSFLFEPIQSVFQGGGRNNAADVTNRRV